ncbi:hypothetical protein [Silanimonas lenta]|uniref:hypothetical protein n=1 Tax=Silanimonas lenta TaxID=265429 RepID=UPI002FDF62D3
MPSNAERARRIVIERPGGYEALRLVEGEVPAPRPGELRLRVAACGVNYADGLNNSARLRDNASP